MCFVNLQGKRKLKNDLQLNPCRFGDYGLSIKTRAMPGFDVYQEKVNCQLGHPFSTVIVYFAKL